jgi:hypothetical protein
VPPTPPTAPPTLPALDDSPLIQKLRAPRQTPAQASDMKKIEARAATQSTAATQWVLNYLDSKKVRSNLDPSLQSLKSEELLERFQWEFARIQVFHNQPVDALDEAQIAAQPNGLKDDTNLNITLQNGWIQNPCQRWALGGPQPLLNAAGYEKFYSTRFGMPTVTDLEHLTLREANDCMPFNANNLRKTSIGNFYFGGFTNVLNTHTLKVRERERSV